MEYRTQEQFDEMCLSLINGNFSQAVAQYVEHGFNAQDLRVMVDNTQWVHDNPYFSSEDFYQVIESASKHEPLDDDDDDALAKAEDYNYYDSVATEKLEGWGEEEEY